MRRGKSITVSGQTFDSIVKAAKHYKVPEGKFRDRLRNGWTPEQAVGLDKPPHEERKKRGVVFKGNGYPNMAALARAYGVTPTNLRQRIDKYGYTLRQALELDPPPPKKSRGGNPVEFEGKVYPSLSALANEYGIKPNLLRQRIEVNGWSYRQALELDSPPKKRSWARDAKTIAGRVYPKGSHGDFKLYLITCTTNGKEYVGITTSSLGKRWGEHVSAAKNDTRGYNKLYHAINKYGPESFKIELLGNDAKDYKELTQQEFQEVEKRDTYQNGYNSTLGGETTHTPRSFEVGGMVFPTLAAAADHFDVDESNIRARIDQMGWTPEQAVGLAPRPTDWGPKEVEVEGHKYPSLKDAAEAYDLPYQMVHLRITRYGWTPEQAFELEPRPNLSGLNGKEVTFRGKKYRSYAQLGAAYGIKGSMLGKRLRKGWSMEQALGLEPNPEPKGTRVEVIFRGQKYPSLKKCAEAFGVSYKLVHRRIKKCYSMEEALGLVKHETPPTKGTAVRIKGKDFISIAEACRHYGVSYVTFKQRRRRELSIEESLGLD